MKDKLNSEALETSPLKEIKQKAKIKKAELEIKEIEQKEEQLENKKQKLIEKRQIESLNEEGQFGTKGEPRKSLSTFFRNQNKLDIGLIGIIDGKASILINLSSTIISALIVFHDFIDNSVKNGYLISIVLVVGLMTTLILSILATKPFASRIRNIVKTQILPNHPNLEENLFAGSQLDCSLKEYEEAMEKLIHRQDLHIGNQIRASYMIGQSNRFKSRLVDWAFNAFLCSFILVGLIYLISNTF